LNFLTLKTFYKREFIIIFFLLLRLISGDEISASNKRSFISGFEVKVHKKKRKHIETSALLCALAINGNSNEEIKNNLYANFKKPISKSDQFLLLNVMNSMCPEFNNKKILGN
jgi:hypothetical protein